MKSGLYNDYNLLNVNKLITGVEVGDNYDFVPTRTSLSFPGFIYSSEASLTRRGRET